MKKLVKFQVTFLLVIWLYNVHDAKGKNPEKDDKYKKVERKEIKSSSLKNNIIQSPIYDAIVLNELLHKQLYYLKPDINANGSWDNQSYFIINLYTEEKIELLPYTQNYKANKLKLQSAGLENRFFNVADSLSKADSLDMTLEEKCRKAIYRILSRNTGIDAEDTIRIFGAIEKAHVRNALFDSTKNIKFINRIAALNESGFNSTSPIGGGAIITPLVDGLAQFLIERANEEINAAVFQKLIKKMDQVPELGILFPNTYNLFKDNKIQVFNYHVALNAMHTVFDEDIKGILGNIRELADLNKYQPYLKDIPELTLLFAQFDIIDGLIKGKNTQEIIQSIYTSGYCLYPENNYANTMKLAGLLSYGMRDIFITDDNKSKRGWIPIGNLLTRKKEEGRDTILKLFIGLLDLNNPGIAFYNANHQPIPSSDIFNKIDLDKTLQLINVYNVSADKINKYFKELDNLKSNENSNLKNVILNEKYKYYRLISDEILSLTIKTLKYIPEPSIQPFAIQATNLKDTYLPVIDQGIKVISDIDKKAYNNVIYDFVELFDKVFAAMDSLKSIKLAFVNTEIEKTSVAIKASKNDETNLKNKKTSLEKDKDILETSIKEVKEDRKFWPDFIEYANLIASLANAENGAEVKQILNNAALPVGSSRIKKYSNFNLAVNAYPGYFVRENKSTDLHPLTGFTNTNGITAPIGLSFSYGFGKAGSISTFAGLLDIGAIVKYHVQNDSTGEPASLESEIELGDIFSPGLSLVYGLPYSIPVSIGGGVQWLPGNLEGGDKLKFEPFWTAFISVDIPLFNLVNKKKPVDFNGKPK